jgi:hypothetical protein
MRPPTTETRIVLRTILSAGVLAVLVLACAGTAESAQSEQGIEMGAGPIPIYQTEKVTSTAKSISTDEVTSSEYNYVSHIFTVADIIFFSYEDGTELSLYDSSGVLIWNNNGNPLNKGGHAHVSVSQGVVFCPNGRPNNKLCYGILCNGPKWIWCKHRALYMGSTIIWAL